MRVVLLREISFLNKQMQFQYDKQCTFHKVLNAVHKIFKYLNKIFFTWKNRAFGAVQTC